VDLVIKSHEKESNLEDEITDLKSYIHTLEKQNKKLLASSKNVPIMTKSDTSETEFFTGETSALPELPSCIPESEYILENGQETVDEVDVLQKLLCPEEEIKTEINTPMPEVTDETQRFQSNWKYFFVDPIYPPHLESEKFIDEKEIARQEKNGAIREDLPLPKPCEVKLTDESNNESKGVIEASSIPDTFDDPHDCCHTNP
jgi:hypothetical protein